MPHACRILRTGSRSDLDDGRTIRVFGIAQRRAEPVRGASRGFPLRYDEDLNSHGERMDRTAELR